MYIAVGITVERPGVGNYTIRQFEDDVVHAVDSVNGHEWAGPVAAFREEMREFDPYYELPPYIGGTVRLERCPFCGSTHLDAAAWSSGGGYTSPAAGGSGWQAPQHGPGCLDCGASAQTYDDWNKRVKL